VLDNGKRSVCGVGIIHRGMLKCRLCAKEDFSTCDKRSNIGCNAGAKEETHLVGRRARGKKIEEGLRGKSLYNGPDHLRIK